MFVGIKVEAVTVAGWFMGLEMEWSEVQTGGLI